MREKFSIQIFRPGMFFERCLIPPIWVCFGKKIFSCPECYLSNNLALSISRYVVLDGFLVVGYLLYGLYAPTVSALAPDKIVQPRHQ